MLPLKEKISECWNNKDVVYVSNPGLIQYEESHNLLILKTPSEKIRVPVASSNIAYLLQVLKENRVCKV